MHLFKTHSIYFPDTARLLLHAFQGFLKKGLFVSYSGNFNTKREKYLNDKYLECYTDYGLHGQYDYIGINRLNKEKDRDFNMDLLLGKF